jgi:NADPH:quinone reductase-like Zn-dependent oxidoreductase
LTLIGTTFRDRGLAELRSLTARLRAEPRLRERWGAIVPTIDDIYQLSDPEPAARRLLSGRHAGKIVLRAGCERTGPDRTRQRGAT